MGPGLARTIAGTAAIAALALAPAGTAPAAGVTKAPRSQLAVARALAGKVARARSAKARYNALLAVARSVGIGVYTGKGKPVVRGAERGRRDFYLYDFELRTLAGTLGERGAWAADDAARILDAAGLRRGGKAFDGATVASVLRAGTRTALRRPAARRSLVPLLVRQLGLRHRPRSDLARPLPAGALKLDALQLLLVSADAAVPVVRAHRPKRAPAAAAACGPFAGGPDPGVLGGFSWNTGNRSVHASAIVLGVLHAIPLAMIGVDVIGSGPDPGQTHYGPPGHAERAGEPLDFEVRVLSQSVPFAPPACGWLFGLALPSAGPVAGALVRWDTTRIDRLEKYGQVRREPAGGPDASLTGSDGLARLHFQPKKELLAGRGREATAAGEIAAHVEFPFVAKAHPAIALVFDTVAATPLSFRWSVSYHQQYVFDVAVQGTQATTWTFSRRDMWSTPCGVNADGSGSQTLSFNPPERVRLAFFEEGGAWQVQPVDEPFLLGRVDVDLSGTLQRSGTLDARDATPEKECAGGGDGGPAPPPPQPDCGTKSATVDGRLSTPPSRLEFTGTFTSSFEHCPAVSQYSQRLLEAGAAIPFDQITDESLGRIVLTGSASQPVDDTQTFTSIVGTTTSEQHETNSLQLELVLDRVDPGT